MKAIIKGGYTTAQNEYLPENTEVEIVGSYCGCGANYYKCVIPSGKQISIESTCIEIIDYTPWVDWEQIKVNAAIAIAQGLAANSTLSSNGEDYIAEKSVRLADKLVERLKGEM